MAASTVDATAIVAFFVPANYNVFSFLTLQSLSIMEAEVSNKNVQQKCAST